jgi:hypothetical protein
MTMSQNPCNATHAPVEVALVEASVVGGVEMEHERLLREEGGVVDEHLEAELERAAGDDEDEFQVPDARHEELHGRTHHDTHEHEARRPDQARHTMLRGRG